MTKPTYEEMLEGACTWRKEHMGVTYTLSFHSYRTGEYSCEGIWCYYLHVPQKMYPHRWDDFRCVGGHGLAFDKVWFDSSITFAESNPYTERQTGEVVDVSKVGCDYGHLWHAEAGYPDTYFSVNLDAINSVESLLKEHPDFNIRCKWSGVWGKPSEFYKAKGGWYVHKDSKVPEHFDLWKPCDE